MATSPNFSWPEPDNTDLVKNGALAIRTAINAIDTSMVDLKGGTTGQVLSKASATDMDFTWVTDATGIPATIIDAKGDLIAGTAADTASRLAVGTNGQVLQADSTAATGLKWATPASSGSLPTFSAYKSGSDQVLTANTFVKITFNTELWDTDNNFASSTFTPTVAGYYSFNLGLYHEQASNGDFQMVIYKNGSRYQRLRITPATGNVAALENGSTIVYCNGSTDYIEIYARGDTGGNTTIYLGNELCYFSGIGIRA